MRGNAFSQLRRISPQRGFTLVEIIIGLVVLSIAIVLLTVLVFPQAQRSAEPLLQMRAAALGQAFLDEIAGKSFDEASDRQGGDLRCGETGAAPCTAPCTDPCTDPCTLPDPLGPDAGETSRDAFDDVDDYHQLEVNFPTLEDALGADIAARYPGFSFAVDVRYSDSNGVCQATVTLYKRIEVTITTSFGQNFTFSSLRGNF